MLELAGGGSARPGRDLRLADLARPLPFGDGAFDDVIAALVRRHRRTRHGPDTPLDLFPPEFGGKNAVRGFLFFVLEAV